MRLSALSLALVASTALITACQQDAPVKSAAADAAPAAAPAPAPAPKPTPQIGSFGFDEGGMDRAVRPGDNFYDYANGTWQKDTVIPADKSNYGAFNVIDDLSRERTRDILEAAKGDPTSKIGTVYSTYLDTAAIDAKGLAPITPWLDQIKGLKSRAGYAALAAQAATNGVGDPFGAYVGVDDKIPTQYALNLSQAGLGMPDRDYYLSTDADKVQTRAAYVTHMAKMLSLAGEPNAEARAKAVLDFETKIAKAHWTRAQSRDSDKTYNKMTLAELAKSAPGFDFATYFKDQGATGVDDVVVAQPSAITGIAKAVSTAPLGVLKDQLLVRSLDSFSDVLPSAFDQEHFAFYEKTLSGTPEQRVRWKRAVDFTTGSIPDEVSKIYVAKYFPPETKAAADKMVRDIIDAMGRRIKALTWMAPETKAKALEKLAAFTPKIGYPSQWHDYSTLKIVAGDAFGNNLRANQWAHADNFAHLGKPIQRWEWFMTPMTVNAYANPVQNEIVFPAAILQPPFFDPNADPAVNYGGIGAVIGHEISHHFDDQGRKYDKNGALTDWWTDEDVKRFKVLTDKLVAEYDAYQPFPDAHVNGSLTLGENIADLAGLTVAWDAYQHAYGDQPAEMIDGFTPVQRFYLGWGQIWRRKYRDANLRQRLLTDPHSPSEFRAAVVRNLDPWYGAFNPAPDSKLYLAPDARVKIW